MVIKIDFISSAIDKIALQRLLEQVLKKNKMMLEQDINYTVQLAKNKKTNVTLSHAVYKYSNNHGKTRYAVRGYQLGCGSFGAVFNVLATIKILKEGLEITYAQQRKYPLVIKIVERDKEWSVSEWQQAIISEIGFIRSLSHAKAAVFFKPSKSIQAYLLMEKYKAQVLSAYIESRFKHESRLSLLTHSLFILSACYTALAVCLAFRWVHINNIVHMDGKLPNIMYNADYNIATVIDLGVAQCKGKEIVKVGGNRKHAAPEVFCGVLKGPVKIASCIDLFALAGIIAKIFNTDTRMPSTKEETRFEIEVVNDKTKIVFVPYNFEKFLIDATQVDQKIKAALKSLVEIMGSAEPEKRPDLEQVITTLKGIKATEIEILRKTWPKNLDLNDTNFFPGLFYAAAANGDEYIIKQLIAKDIDVDTGMAKKSNRNVAVSPATPLFLAAQNNQPQVVAALLAAGANPNKSIGNERLLIYMNLQQYLFRSNCGLSDNLAGYTPLHIAALNGHHEVVTVLLAQAKNLILDGAAKDGATPFFLAAFSGCNVAAEKLLDAGVNPNVVHLKSQSTPLIIAVLTKNQQLIAKLLKHGANPDLATQKYKTPRMLATELNYINEFETLVAEAEQARDKKEKPSELRPT